MSDSEQEYEVESVTRARVHDKRGKKLIWRYYVKWKGYGWDECTWEPIEHFTDGAEKIIENFWECVDIGGRDIHDATAFKREKKGLKRKQSTSSVRQSPRHSHAISAPITTPRKRRKVQRPYDDVLESIQPKRQTRTPRSRRKSSSGKSAPNAKRRRASSPGPRRIASRNSPSTTNSELDAEGEIDPDFEVETQEVEDVLRQSSMEDGDERPQREGMTRSSVSKTRQIQARYKHPQRHQGLQQLRLLSFVNDPRTLLLRSIELEQRIRWSSSLIPHRLKHQRELLPPRHD
ncbi:hypothetical protein M404DRAFT_591268 [Pisolithus tinctorius Marx 270]|uniref:Chromo domain-containing protein n=1 Tax=Pisolithus tinctorius Marx 270 TaxID=870435 RepID=A0A0C3KVR3_PISTI|nr:hypothetical protein M404DRAFT_591268 [Pisolithus tinctorius Marx 270]